MLDERIERWFPACPPEWRPITIHHLLTHTSGINHRSSLPGFLPSCSIDAEERIALFQQAPLVGPPGARWRYSSPGYVLLGRIVERVCGQPYPGFLAERIFGPLAMTATVCGRLPTEAGVARRGRPVTDDDMSTLTGTGDVWSAVDDLARYTCAINSGRLLSPGSLRTLTEAHAQVPPEAVTSSLMAGRAYGYGQFVGTVGGHMAYFQGGDNPGFLSFNAWLPEWDATVTVLTNEETSDLERLVRQLLPIVVKG